MRFQVSMLVILPLLPLLLASCAVGDSGDGDGSSAQTPQAATTHVTEFHASGRIAASGDVVTSSRARTGAWVEYHDAEGNPLRWQGTYSAGAIDDALHWCEWNPDGSIRVEQGDR